MKVFASAPFQFGGSKFVSMGQALRGPVLGSQADDIAWFEANRVQIAAQYPGQWVLVKEKAVVGAYADFQSAYAAGVAMFGDGTFVVKEAKAEETPIRLVGRMP